MLEGSRHRGFRVTVPVHSKCSQKEEGLHYKDHKSVEPPYKGELIPHPEIRVGQEIQLEQVLQVSSNIQKIHAKTIGGNRGRIPEGGPKNQLGLRNRGCFLQEESESGGHHQLATA